jgi:hypothetical protein
VANAFQRSAFQDDAYQGGDQAEVVVRRPKRAPRLKVISEGYAVVTGSLVYTFVGKVTATGQHYEEAVARARSLFGGMEALPARVKAAASGTAHPRVPMVVKSRVHPVSAFGSATIQIDPHPSRSRTGHVMGMAQGVGKASSGVVYTHTPKVLASGITNPTPEEMFAMVHSLRNLKKKRT